MDVLRNFSGVEQHHESQGSCGVENSQPNLAPRFTTFRNIPPERVGLNGEYDHGGLAKRVSLRFSQSFEATEIENLRIIQRGAVVVLLGKIPNRRLLTQMIAIALGTSGAVDVEINGISVVQSYKPNFRANLGDSMESSAGSRRDRHSNKSFQTC
ncbi:hypothetical protein H6F88_09065 [Oculatella sp. FACHB-28]|uniref:hypothetical protein n=1 Tax=Oculatella sp. FACHB-28 TaxID=2692845 RepID=UPI001686EFF7|nr:hypothetical protein [Oculatella sp. FACHB-28]MBD2056167.1 hypothetical protein [Oculatella sp. FACHB-28]